MGLVIFLRRFKVEIMEYMKEVLEGHNTEIKKKEELFKMANSYGAVFLKNGSVVSLRENFNTLKRLFIIYNHVLFYKEELSEPDKYSEFMTETNGGIFVSFETTVRFKDIDFLMDVSAQSAMDKEMLIDMESRSSLIKNFINENHTIGGMPGLQFDDGLDEI